MDKQLIMSRTGHSSTDGVRAYKRPSSKLKKITSDVLNQSAPPAARAVEKRPEHEAVKPPYQEERTKEIHQTKCQPFRSQEAPTSPSSDTKSK